MHRFTWDLRYDPIGQEPRGEGPATGAVPHRTYPQADAPWAPPGQYTVRLTVNDTHFTQPLTLRLDPRVQTSAADLNRLATLTREMYDGAVAAHAAYEQARTLSATLDKANSSDAKAFKAKLETVAPAPRPRSRRFFFRRPQPSGPPTLNGVSSEMMRAAMAMQSADVAPTAREVAACNEASTHSKDVMARWQTLSTSGLAALNAKLKAQGLPAVRLQ